MEAEIEITPAMIAAGISAYSLHDGFVLGDLVAEIYRAMETANRRSSGGLDYAPSQRDDHKASE